MLKVFLVEDEFVVRQGIKNIDWTSHGYEFCGEASDGELALPQIDKLRPDIVITDIKMPFMDGLELSRHIRKEYPEIEIVILSGYEEFSYAREAISLGVSRYLSKPISAADLIAEIDQLKISIENKKREREIANRYLKDMKEDTDKAKKLFFNDCVSGKKTVSEILEASEKLGINLNASVYAIGLGIIQATNHTNTEYSKTLIMAQNETMNLMNRHGLISFDRDLEGTAFIFMADSEQEMETLLRETENDFSLLFSKYENLRFYAGVGIPVYRISELNKSFATAGKAFAHRYFESKNNIVYASDKLSAPIEINDDIAINEINHRVFDRTRVADFLKTGEESEIEFFMAELFDSLGTEAIKSNMFRQYIAMDMYFIICDFVANLGLDTDSIEPVDSRLQVAESVSSVREYCNRIVTDSIAKRDSISHNKYKDYVDRVISYIEENYSDENLSLNTLAEHVRFSPNHLSMIFSQQMGMTLSKYLIDFRINKAKEALKCTSMKSSEIALEIGYKDPHYFSYMFKKITGMTPTQYREGKND